MSEQAMQEEVKKLVGSVIANVLRQAQCVQCETRPAAEGSRRI